MHTRLNDIISVLVILNDGISARSRSSRGFSAEISVSAAALKDSAEPHCQYWIWRSAEVRPWRNSSMDWEAQSIWEEKHAESSPELHKKCWTESSPCWCLGANWIVTGYENEKKTVVVRSWFMHSYHRTLEFLDRWSIFENQ